MTQVSRNVRFTPKSGHVQCNEGCPLSANSGHLSVLDHLVSAGEQHRRHCQTKRFCSGQIDDKIELGRLLDWNIARFRSTQNPIDIFSGTPEQRRIVWSIGQ